MGNRRRIPDPTLHLGGPPTKKSRLRLLRYFVFLPPLTVLVFPIFLRGRGPSSKQPSESSERDYWHFYPSSFVKKWSKKPFIFPSPSSVELIIFGHPIYLAPTKKTKIKYPKPVNNDLKRKTAESPLEDFFLKKERRRRFPTSFIMFCVVSFSA